MARTEAAVGAPARRGQRTLVRSAVLADLPKHLVLGTLALFTFVPFFIVIITSFKDLPQFYDNFWLPAWPLHPENYLDAWDAIKIYLLNSILVTTVSIAGILLFSSMAAYALARYRFPGSTVVYYMILSVLMIPFILTLVPEFMLYKTFGLLNTYWVLIIHYVARHQAFAVFIQRSFIAALPEELFEAARVDGASHFQLYRLIVVPLSVPILVTVAIIDLLAVWNDYIWPLTTVQDQRLMTLTVGIVSFQGQVITRYGPMMAGYVLASLPLILVFFLFMRAFINGLTSGALKV